MIPGALHSISNISTVFVPPKCDRILETPEGLHAEISPSSKRKVISSRFLGPGPASALRLAKRAGAPRREIRLRARSITTLEGLGSPEALDRVQAAFVAEQAAQCGYCTNGMIMAACTTRNRRIYQRLRHHGRPAVVDKEGYLNLPQGPGLGVTIKQELIA